MPSIEEIANNLDFDIEDVTMLLDMFIENSKESLSKIQEGISTSNYELISNAAHAIKGSALNLTLEDVSKVAQRLEQCAKDKDQVDYTDLYNSLNHQINLVEKLRIPYAL
jgi:HPt (histidine-containing phosphotransfer) domain-containing protein